MYLSLPGKQLSPRVRKVMAEIMGTFYLTLVVSLAMQPATMTLLPSLAVSFLLVTQVSTYGYISCQFNPAVSFAFMLVGAQTAGETLVLVFFQCATALVAALVAWFLVGDGSKLPSIQPVQGGDFVAIVRASVCEGIFTCCLVSSCLHCLGSSQKSNHFYPLGIGLVIGVGSFVVSNISTGMFNPAISTSLQLVQCMAVSCDSLKYIWLYWSSSLVGAFVAACNYLSMQPHMGGPRKEDNLYHAIQE